MEPTASTDSRTALSRRSFLGAGVAAGGLLLVDPLGASASRFAPAGLPSSARTANLRVGVPVDIQAGAMLRFTPGNRPVRRTVFDVVVDRAPDGTYLPGLATEWEWDGAGTTLVIKLRDDATFHTGRPFGADDVLFLVEKALEEGSGAQVASLLRRGDLRKTGDHELTVEFESPFTSYLDAYASLPVIDSETFDDIESGEQIVGTGPFTWQSWTPGSAFEMQRNDTYWGGEVAFDQLSFTVISEPQASLAAMQSDELDLNAGMVARDAAMLAERGFPTFLSPGFDFYVGVNTQVPPLDDVRVRQAIAYALDRDRIVDQVFSGLATASSIPWSPDTPGVTLEMINHYSYDPERARALLEEAGAMGAEVAITPSPQEPAYSAVAEIVQFGLSEIGLRPRSTAVDAAEFPSHMQAGEFEGLWVAIVGLSALGPATSLLTANPLLATENSHNYDSTEYQDLHAAVVDASSDDEQASALTELTGHLLEQAFHNSVVQASTLAVGTEGLDGVEYDATLSLVLTKAQLVT